MAALRLPGADGWAAALAEVRVPVASLLRLSRWPGTEPHWSQGQHRFDPPAGAPGPAWGVCYAASSLEVAFAESVIHSSALFVAGAYQVPWAELRQRRLVRFVLADGRSRLRLADLCGLPLKKLGLNNDISAGDDYGPSQQWAQAIHQAAGHWDGIRYLSRQMNRGYAYALFQRSGLQLAQAPARALTDAELDALCDRFNVAVV